MSRSTRTVHTLTMVMWAIGAFGSFGAFDLSEASQVPAKRVISLIPALTEMIFAIGAGANVVAVSSYDEDPPQVKSLPKVGALIDPDVERIIALRPDLVLLYTSQTDLMTQLSRAKIPYYEYRHGGLASVTTTIRALGERTGRAREAEALAAGIDRRLAALRQRTAGSRKPRTLLVFGRERGSLRNIYASGGRGFLHEMLEAAGGANVFAGIQAESVQASTEMILAQKPEVIIELRSTDIPAQDQRATEINSWKTLASVPAVRNGRIYLLSGRTLVVPGPRVADGAEQFARVLHPTLRLEDRREMEGGTTMKLERGITARWRAELLGLSDSRGRLRWRAGLSWPERRPWSPESKAVPPLR